METNPGEKTLVLIKPDAVERRLIGAIIGRIEARGLAPRRMIMTTATRQQIDAHYAHMLESPHYPRILAWMTRGPLVAMIVPGTGSIDALRQIIGATDPIKAEIGTIRRDLASWIGANLVHASESQDACERESAIWFPEAP